MKSGNHNTIEIYPFNNKKNQIIRIITFQESSIFGNVL